MFKNHAVQVKMINTKKNAEPTPVPEDTFIDNTTMVTVATKEVIREGMKLAAVIIVLDTGRKALLELLAK